MTYNLNQNSVITTIFVPRGLSFLSCGGTNTNTPKSGVSWDNFTVQTTNFKYIFNSNNFISGAPSPIVIGYTEATVPITIKQFLYNNLIIEYVCGKFSIGDKNNIMYFNPRDTGKTKPAIFNEIKDGSNNKITFTGTNNSVNCITPSLSNTYTQIYLAGRFDSVQINTTTTQNINVVRLNVSTVPTWTIDTSFTTTAATLLHDINVTINSMIVFKNILYIGGTNTSTNNCILYRFNNTGWKNLLSSNYTGSINTLIAINDKNQIAIGGQFTTLGNATNCNNIVIYNIISTNFTGLGTGVTDIPSPPIANYPTAAQVYALSYFQATPGFLWVGGYFINAGGSLSNSIAFYNFLTNSWNSVLINGSSVVGLREFSGGSNPGVVYTLTSAEMDTSNITVGGSFITTTTAIPSNESVTIYNLVKITLKTINSNTKRNFTKYNSLSN
jgi:hypothetical protein